MVKIARGPRRLPLVALVAVLLFGCGSAPTATTAPAATPALPGITQAPTAAATAVPATPATTSSEAPTPTDQPTAATTPSDSIAFVPSELQGEWTTTLGPGDSVTLRFGDTTYRIIRGGFSGGGRVVVVGSQIEFSNHPDCRDKGTYTWTISDDVLSFAPGAEPDPCPRRGVLEDREYTRT